MVLPPQRRCGELDLRDERGQVDVAPPPAVQREVDEHRRESTLSMLTPLDDGLTLGLVSVDQGEQIGLLFLGAAMPPRFTDCHAVDALLNEQPYDMPEMHYRLGPINGTYMESILGVMPEAEIARIAGAYRFRMRFCRTEIRFTRWMRSGFEAFLQAVRQDRAAGVQVRGRAETRGRNATPVDSPAAPSAPAAPPPPPRGRHPHRRETPPASPAAPAVPGRTPQTI